MSEIDEEDDNSFPSFNGMNRPAMVYGVPMVLGIFTVLFILASFFGGLLIGLGIYISAILPTLGFAFLLFIKIICEDDPNAFAFVKWRLKAILLKIIQGNPIIFVTSNNEKRKVLNANRQFKKW